MKYILVPILLISHLVVYAQQTPGCDKVWKKVEIAASYSGGALALSQYNNKELMQAYMDCYDKEGILIPNITMDLTINKKGVVVNATIMDSDIPATCKELLIKKLLTMKGWIPAQNKGKPVCSIYRWHIACMRWEVE